MLCFFFFAVALSSYKFAPMSNHQWSRPIDRENAHIKPTATLLHVCVWEATGKCERDNCRSCFPSPIDYFPDINPVRPATIYRMYICVCVLWLMPSDLLQRIHCWMKRCEATIYISYNHPLYILSPLAPSFRIKFHARILRRHDKLRAFYVDCGVWQSSLEASRRIHPAKSACAVRREYVCRRLPHGFFRI